MRALVLLLLLLSAGLAGCGGPPDIVLVTISSLRRDHVGAYGWKLPGDSPTPHLDALAARARVFDGATTTMPVPTAAQASIMTGLPAAQHGVVSNGQRVTEAMAAERGLPGQLAAAGYRVAAFVSTNAFGDRLGLGAFDPWDAKPKGWRRGADAVEHALAWLDRTAHGEKRPVFVWIQIQDVHAPYGGSAVREAGGRYDAKSYGFVDRARYKDKRARIEMTKRYAAGVREADAALGDLLDGLAKLGRDPLIFVAADHGEFMAEPLDRIGFAYGHGLLLGPEVAWIPLVAAGPGVEPGRVAGAASLTDLYTTILEAAGVGDPRAALEMRADLLRDLPADRVVHTARRAVRAAQLAKRGASPAAIRAIAARAVAVTDGTSLVLVGEDGKPAEPGAAALVAAAQSFLVAP
ncbi:MAG TPA: sulfatase, partial [Myxococcota bacterium]|nr:sulfatase [Myxococcota bacterium]